MNDGEDGSEASVEASELEANGGCIESPFMLRGRLGPGDVMGRTRVVGSETFKVAMDERPPNVGPAKEDRGIKLTGESGDEDGDWSDNDEESVQEAVVVGDESLDSVICVEVLSWCLCCGSEGRAAGCNGCCFC